MDGSEAGCLPVWTPEMVATRAAELRAAQPAWADLGPAGRGAYLKDWLDWILDHEAHLLELVQRESGKSRGDANFETMMAIQIIAHITKNAPGWLADRHPRPSGVANATKRLRVFAKPYQLVGVITPWNFPLGMPLLDVPFALAAGAAVLSKPSEVTPLAWTEAVRGWDEIGAPPVLACATGLGSTGAAIVDVVDMIQFTGSTRTGRAIAAQAAQRLIPCSLELGGKDAMIVLEDADLDRAVGGAIWGGLFNAGQACVSVERIYVHEAVYDRFVTKLVAEADAVRQGTDTDESYSNDIGAMATPGQVAIVERHVQDAVVRGARVLTSQRRPTTGLYFPPTVLVDVDHSMLCMQEETFGPTLPVMKVRDEDEAIRLANDSPYGLSASVWTRDRARAERVARRLESGSVCANNVMANVFQFGLPMGGWKQSGQGFRLGGAHSVRKYCSEQAYVSERVRYRRELHWYPYRPNRVQAINRAVRFIGMSDWRRRLGRPPQR